MATTRITILICLVLLGFYGPTDGIAQSEYMTVVYARNFDPFSWNNSNNDAHGILIDFVDEIIGKRMGISVKHEIYPWARAQYKVKQGDKDAFVTIPNIERRKYAYVSKYPFFISDFILFTGVSNEKLESIKRITNLEELRSASQLKNAHIIGGGWHIQNLKGVGNITRVDDSRKILELLKYNRVDVYIEQAALLQYQIKKYNYKKDITAIPNVMDSTRWHICIGKKSSYSRIIPELNNMLELMKKDGSLKKIRTQIFNQYK